MKATDGMTPLEKLHYYTTGAIERGEGTAITEIRPYFAEGTPAMIDLEAMVDRVGALNVLYALQLIAFSKAAHLRANWQDYAASWPGWEAAAKDWTLTARIIGHCADNITERVYY
jgi:hypothetical protein